MVERFQALEDLLLNEAGSSSTKRALWDEVEELTSLHARMQLLTSVEDPRTILVLEPQDGVYLLTGDVPHPKWIIIYTANETAQQLAATRIVGA